MKIYCHACMCEHESQDISLSGGVKINIIPCPKIEPNYVLIVPPGHKASQLSNEPGEVKPADLPQS